MGRLSCWLPLSSTKETTTGAWVLSEIGRIWLGEVAQIEVGSSGNHGTAAATASSVPERPLMKFERLTSTVGPEETQRLREEISKTKRDRRTARELTQRSSSVIRDAESVLDKFRKSGDSLIQRHGKFDKNDKEMLDDLTKNLHRLREQTVSKINLFAFDKPQERQTRIYIHGDRGLTSKEDKGKSGFEDKGKTDRSTGFTKK